MGQVDDRNFVYPEAVKRRELFAEEIEEAIIQYLERAGFDADELRESPFYFVHPDTGRELTTKLLTIRWR